MTATGSCLCGEVKFTATPAENKVGVCHCDICRTQTAGPFFGIDCGDSLEIEDTPFFGIYRSSEWAERGFCKKCGTVIFWRTHDKELNIISVDTLKGLENLTLDHEVFIDSKPDYYNFAEKTHKMTGQEVFDAFAAGKDS